MTIKLKYRLSLNTGGIWGEDPNGVDDTTVLRSTDQTMDGGWQISNPAVRAISPPDVDRYRLKQGDILITKASGSDQHIGKASLVSKEVTELNAVYSNFNQRVRLVPGEDPRFYWYFMNSALARHHYVVNASSTSGLGNLNADIIGELPAPRFNLRTQQRIADFLDRETARIDELIEKKERLVQLLKERQNVIVNGRVFPSEQKTGPRLRYLVKANPSQEGVETLADETPIVFVPMEAIGDETGGVNLSNRRPLLELKRGSYNFFQNGDILLAKVTPCFENGKIAVIDDLPLGFGYATSEVHVIRVRPNLIDRNYLKYLFSSVSFKTAGVSNMTGASGLRRVPIDMILDFRLPVRDIAVQRRIALSLDNEIASSQITLNKVRDSVAKLRELRSALITAAVTGQINVN